MKKILLSLICILLITSLFALKTDGIVKGRVFDKETKEPLPYATVVIRDADNKIVGGATSSKDGYFIINRLIHGKCTIEVKFMGYKDSLFNVEIKEDSIEHNLGDIMLNSDAQLLSSVVVTSKLPIIEQKLDKIVMNVSGVISTQSSNALDILRRAPGITVNPDGEIMLNGNKVAVWIDNRPSNLSGKELEALLSGTDGGTIDKIEIISHPSAKYDAAGSGGILNILTKKSFAQGLNGSVNANYSGILYDKYYNGGNGNIMLNYRTDKTNTLLTYGSSYNQNFSKITTESRMGKDQKMLGYSMHNEIGRNHNYKLSQDFFINKRNILGFVISGIQKRDRANTDKDSGNRLYRASTLIEETDSRINNNSDFGNISANINYTHYFDGNKELTINADYGYYDISKNNSQHNSYHYNLNSSLVKPDEEFKDISSQYINIKSIKADYTQPLGMGSLEIGLKWAGTNTRNNLRREEKKASNWVPNKRFDNLFDYDEQISAAYITYSKMLSKQWVLKLGLRGEMTNSFGKWISMDTCTVNNYFNIFPTLFVGYNPNQNFRYGFSYTRRISRPGFTHLNPFRSYIDAYNSQEGNPKLLPEFSHNIAFNFGYGQHISLGLFGNFGYNGIMPNTVVNNETGERRFIFENQGVKSFQGMALSISEYSITEWLTTNINIFGAYTSSTMSEKDTKGWFGSANIGARFYLPKDFKIELNGWGLSRIPFGYYKIEPQYQISLSAKKDVLAGKGTISLSINDLFRTGRNKLSIDKGVDNLFKTNSIRKTQEIIIGFSYRFGQGKGYKQRKVGNIEEAGRVTSGSNLIDNTGGNIGK